MLTISKNAVKLENPLYYNNRELSWLDFNKRVLEETIDHHNPLLERVKFLAIFSSNLDEFYMVRVAGLQDQVKVGYKKPENKAGLTPKQQLAKISKKTHSLVEMQYQTLKKILLPELLAEKIEFLKIGNLTVEQLKEIEDYFDEQIFPVLTPMAVDAYRPFPLLLNKSLNIAVLIECKNKDGETRLKTAIVQVPAVLDRFIRLNTGNKVQLILLEDVLLYFIHKLFTGYKVVAASVFRITRNADQPIHEDEVSDLLTEIEKELKVRKWGAVVRLEIQQKGLDKRILRYLAKELEIKEQDVYEIDGPLDLTIFFDFYKKAKPIYQHLVYEPLIPQAPRDLAPDEDLFEKIAKQDILVHHPYESFQPVIDFVAKAAVDPDVLAIKQTLYRVSGDSPIIKALKKAAEHKKQVTVLVELKARFDEEHNVHWAKELEMAGCQVIYGINHLKTHSKITLVVRRKNHRIERFVHLGTGNYNDQTAKVYTDLGLFTAKRKFGIDATNFFNYLSGYTEKPVFYHLSMAPFDIRKDFMKLIDEEINCHKKYSNGHIIAKINSLADKALIMKLYEASNAGVKIDLMVRGICCLRPGIKGISEHIRVRSIVGRFLEHSRIYYFHHNGEKKIYLSSADLMTRNMDKRIELLFPIFDGPIKSRLYEIVQIMLDDNVKSREQDENGHYHYVSRDIAEQEMDAQLVLFDQAYQAAAAKEQG